MSSPRIYLTGEVALEYGDRLVPASALPGRQGRLAFVWLTVHRDRPAARHELIDAIWGDDAPREVESSLNAILSKIRATLKKVGWSVQEATLESRANSVGIRFPPETWIDLEAAASALDEAEGALRAGAPTKAWGFANVAVSIARRPFLAGEEAPWIQGQRAAHRVLLRRGLESLATASALGRELALAVQYASEVLALDPFLESAYRRLMRLHAEMGNRAEALRVFGRCREWLRDELGASPSPQTEAVFLDILRSGA